MLGKLFKREAKPLAKINIQPHGVTIEGKEKYAILDTALSQGIDFPHNCRVGGCGACKCKLIEGEVRQLTDASYVLSQDELDEGYVLACQSLPRSDVSVVIPGLSAEQVTTANAVKEMMATISGTRSLTHDILEVTLTLDEALAFDAGQYLDLSIDGIVEKARSYSFANAPNNIGKAQSVATVHIRHVPGGQFTDWLHAQDRSNTRVKVHGPFGQFGLQPGNEPMICIAGGSGMAPIKAILEAMRDQKIARDVTYFFGARTQADLYALDDMAALAKHWPTKFEFVPVLSEEPADSDWAGLRGLVTEPLAEHAKLLGPQLASNQAYLCGPPPMLDAAMDILQACGLAKSAMFFDKFLDSSHNQN